MGGRVGWVGGWVGRVNKFRVQGFGFKVSRLGVRVRELRRSLDKAGLRLRSSYRSEVI